MGDDVDSTLVNILAVYPQFTKECMFHFDEVDKLCVIIIATSQEVYIFFDRFTHTIEIVDQFFI